VGAPKTSNCTTMNVYGDVVMDEMEQAHSKVVRIALVPVN
jgi:hypothetical protein